MVFCDECGAEISQESGFCENCGAKAAEAFQEDDFHEEYSEETEETVDSDPAPQKEPRPENYITSADPGIRAHALLKAGYYREALEVINQIVDRKPNDTYWLLTRAKAYFEIGEYQKSIDDNAKLILLYEAGRNTISGWKNRVKAAQAELKKAQKMLSPNAPEPKKGLFGLFGKK